MTGRKLLPPRRQTKAKRMGPAVVQLAFVSYGFGTVVGIS